LPGLNTIIPASQITLWSNTKGQPISQLAVNVPAGRYAWKARISFGSGETRLDAIEPHINYGTRAHGLFQQTCKF
jgi:hypothetical protein